MTRPPVPLGIDRERVKRALVHLARQEGVLATSARIPDADALEDLRILIVFAQHGTRDGVAPEPTA